MLGTEVITITRNHPGQSPGLVWLPTDDPIGREGEICLIDRQAVPGAACALVWVSSVAKTARMMEEASDTCSSCGEEIVIPLDLSAGARQDFVEDCPVCCRANEIHIRIDEHGVTVWAQAE